MNYALVLHGKSGTRPQRVMTQPNAFCLASRPAGITLIMDVRNGKQWSRPPVELATVVSENMHVTFVATQRFCT